MARRSPSWLAIDHRTDPVGILSECVKLLEAGLYDPAYDIHGRQGEGLLCLYARAVHEAETRITVLWVARCVGQPIGVAAVAGDEGNILHMFVTPAWRGKGIGNHLLSQVLRQHNGDLAVHYSADNFNFFNRRGMNPVHLQTFGQLALAQVTPAPAAHQLRARP